VIEKLEFQGKLWKVINKVSVNHIDNHTKLKQNYGCDLVVKNNTHYWVLDEILEGEFEELN
jgi:16S rRNA G1207 methylase RsmC